MTPDTVIFDNLVYSGKIRDGQIFREQDLIDEAKRVGKDVSRTIVREILSFLQAFNLVKSQNGVGVIIPVLDDEQFDRAVAHRFRVEEIALVAVLKKININKRDYSTSFRKVFLQEMDAKIHLMEHWGEAKNYTEFFRADCEFHATPAKLINDDVLYGTIKALFLRTFLSSQSGVFFEPGEKGQNTARELVFHGRMPIVHLHRDIYNFILESNYSDENIDGYLLTLEARELLNSHLTAMRGFWRQAYNQLNGDSFDLSVLPSPTPFRPSFALL